MALRYTGGAVLKTLKLSLVNSSFVVQSTLNFPVRNAARKGYRDKVMKAKQQKKLEAPVPVGKEEFKLRKKLVSVSPTVESNKLMYPVDDVYIMKNFKLCKYSIFDASDLHKEYHHPTVFNNPNSQIRVVIELNLSGKKKTTNQFSGVAPIPHTFNMGLKREVLVFCKSSLVDTAIASGAQVAGAEDLVKKVQAGIVTPNLFEYVICDLEFLPNLSPIRNALKLKYPKLKNGTLTTDLQQSLKKFLYGIEYTIVRVQSQKDFGVVECPIGTTDLDSKKIEENFKALIKNIKENMSTKTGDLFQWIWCTSPPSKERFPIDLSLYIESKNDDGEDEEEVEEVSEKNKIKDLKRQLEEGVVMSELSNYNETQVERK